MIELAEASIHIDAPQAEVFDLFTTEVGLCSWMAKEAAIDLRPGGKWRWVHDNGVATSGEYELVEPHDRIRFTYGWESGRFADMGPGSTTVTVTFEPDHTPEAAGTTVTVKHSAVPPAFKDAHAAGWHYFLELLGSAATGSPLPAVRIPNTAENEGVD